MELFFSYWLHYYVPSYLLDSNGKTRDLWCTQGTDLYHRIVKGILIRKKIWTDFLNLLPFCGFQERMMNLFTIDSSIASSRNFHFALSTWEYSCQDLPLLLTHVQYDLFCKLIACSLLRRFNIVFFSLITRYLPTNPFMQKIFNEFKNF